MAYEGVPRAWLCSGEYVNQQGLGITGTAAGLSHFSDTAQAQGLEKSQCDQNVTDLPSDNVFPLESTGCTQTAAHCYIATIMAHCVLSCCPFTCDRVCQKTPSKLTDTLHASYILLLR